MNILVRQILEEQEHLLANREHFSFLCDFADVESV